MANLCSSDIYFYAKEDKRNQLLDFYNKVKSWFSPQKNPKRPGMVVNDKKLYGLSRALILSGCYQTDEKGEITSPSCPYHRGTVETISEIEKNMFSISTETDWTPAVKMWQEIIDFLEYDIYIRYVAEESGNDVFLTNIKDYVGYYRIDWSSGFNSDIEGPLPEEDTKKLLQKILKTKENNMDKLKEMAENFTVSGIDDHFIILNNYSYCAIEDC